MFRDLDFGTHGTCSYAYFKILYIVYKLVRGKSHVFDWYIPSDTTSILNAYVKYFIRYNNQILCIFTTVHHIQQVYYMHI